MADIERVDRIVQRWSCDPEYVIEMLQDIQDLYRYIPEEALKRVAGLTGVPRGRLFHIATFYSAFSLRPRGEYRIQVCMGTTCYVKGAPEVIASLQRRLGVEEGETTSDGRFSIERVRCLGCCGLAPAVAVNGEVVGSVRPSEVGDLLARFE
jgi:NADH:ubiquinone oxidoreductase subunit E